MDQNGNPVVGAKITWSNNQLSTYTISWSFPGHQGKYAKNLIAGTYTRTIEKTGCITRIDLNQIRNDGQNYFIGDLAIQC